MKKRGRPTIYSQELANEVCKRLSKGNSLRKVCEADDMPNADTIFQWLHDKQDFSEQYAQACVERTESQHEVLVDLGDEAIKLSQSVDPKASNAVVSAVKLKADNFKWLMSKMKPKKYGDKIDMTTNGKDLPAPMYGGASTKI